MAKLDDIQAQQRAAMLRQSRRELLAVLLNSDGLKRIRNIDPAAWANAEAQDLEEGQTSEGLASRNGQAH